MPVLRTPLALALGALAGDLVVMLVPMLSMSMSPLPSDVNPSDPARCGRAS